MTAKRLIMRLIAVLGVGVTVAGLYEFYGGMLSGPAPPPPMTGDLNVAVAGFTSRTESGDAAALSTSFFEGVRDELRTLELSGPRQLDIAVRGPADLDSASGATPGQRAKSASKIAASLGADIVVYGTVTAAGDTITVSPEFVFDEGHTSHPEDHEPLLMSVSVPPTSATRQPVGSITKSGALAGSIPARAELRSELVARTRSFAAFLAGLGYYTNALAAQQADQVAANYRAAARYFGAAERAHGWDPRVTELLYLFLGNTALGQRQFTRAETYYRRALDARPGYPRASLGLAEARFHRARGNCQRPDVDAAGLNAAVRGYRAVLRAVGENPSILSARAQFGLGRAAFCLSAAGMRDDWSSAQRHFDNVTAAYAQGFQAIRAEAAEAYTGIGLALLLADADDRRGALRKAVRAFSDALAVTRRPETRGLTHSFRAAAYAELGETARALADYRAAIRMDPRNRKTYLRDQRDALKP